MANKTEEEIEALSDDEYIEYMENQIAIPDEDVQLDNPDDEEDIVETEDPEPGSGEEDTDETVELDDPADELEQPEDDSDGEVATDSNEQAEEDDELEEKEDGTEDNPGEPVEEKLDTDESKPTEKETKAETKIKQEEPKATDKYAIRANGMDFEFTNAEMLKMMPKAMDYTKKMQEIKPHRKNIGMMVDNGITTEDLNLLIDMKKGDVNAFNVMAKASKIETLDLDVEKAGDYKFNEYGKSDGDLNMQEALKDISGDTVNYGRTTDILGKQWDEKSWATVQANPEHVKSLHEDVSNGMFDKINPIAAKMKVMDGGTKSDIDYYIQAATSYNQELAHNSKVEATKVEDTRLAEAAKVLAREELTKAEAEKSVIADAKKKEAKRVANKKAANKRKAAATTKSGSGTVNVIDYLDDDSLDDDAFMAMMDKQIAKR